MCHVRVIPLIDRTWSHVLCIGVDPGLGSQSLVTLSVVVGVVVDEHGMPLDLILPHDTLVNTECISSKHTLHVRWCVCNVRVGLFSCVCMSVH